MSNANLPDVWLDDGRVSRLPGAAHKLYVNATLWCWRHNTDGFVPAAVWSTLVREGVRQEMTDRLDKDGLAEAVPGEGGELAGYVLPAYLDEQPSRAKRASWREKGNERAQRHRERVKAGGDTPGPPGVPTDLRRTSPHDQHDSAP